MDTAHNMGNEILNNEIGEVKKKVRNKDKVYAEQRKELLNKVYTIIGLENNDHFYSHEITNSEDIQKQIFDLSDDIIKYYATSTWSAFKKTVDVENKALSMIRSILKDNNVKVKSVPEKIKINNKSISTTLYTVTK
jgi:hypothetical protein